MLTFFVVTTLLLTATTIVLGWFSYKLSNVVFSLEDQVEESLDILDVCYKRISDASQVPVLYDEPVIKGVVQDIAMSRDAILVVANKINFSNQQK